MDRIRHFHDVNGASESDIYAVGLRSDIFHFDGTRWRQLACPIRADLFRIDASDAGDILIVGRDGVVLRGNHHSGFRQVSNLGQQYFTDVARYRDRIYLAASRGLFELDPRTEDIRACDTGLDPEIADCHRPDAHDGVLWSFGNKDLAWYDGRGLASRAASGQSADPLTGFMESAPMRDNADGAEVAWSRAAVWGEFHQTWSRDVVSDLAGEDAILVDARRCRCPVPVQRLRKALPHHVVGQVLVILADDPSARADIPDAVRFLGQTLLSTISCGSDMAFIIRRA